MKQIAINTDHLQHATRDHPAEQPLADSLPEAKETMLHPRRAGNENASLYFVGTATTILYVAHMPSLYFWFFFGFFQLKYSLTATSENGKVSGS